MASPSASASADPLPVEQGKAPVRQIGRVEPPADDVRDIVGPHSR
ncbi:hypothetical protein BURPS668_A1593 [Burkholderia pseudomallei 668]|nr:hypothetical protein BURPS668_A1593 [Burkholderia pseudomallei 668]